MGESNWPTDPVPDPARTAPQPDAVAPIPAIGRLPRDPVDTCSTAQQRGPAPRPHTTTPAPLDLGGCTTETAREATDLLVEAVVISNQGGSLPMDDPAATPRAEIGHQRQPVIQEGGGPNRCLKQRLTVLPDLLIVKQLSQLPTCSKHNAGDPKFLGAEESVIRWTGQPIQRQAVTGLAQGKQIRFVWRADAC